MLRIFLTLLVIGCASLLPQSLTAQEAARFMAEGRLKMVVPEGRWNDDNDINRGMGGGLNGQIWLVPFFGVYGGWDWVQFTIDRPDLPHTVSSTAIDSGYRFGFLTPYVRGPIGSFIFAGGIFNTTSFAIFDNREGRSITSNRELGTEIGAGLIIPVGPLASLTPQLGYRTHRANFGGPGVNETTVSYIMLDLGLRMNLER
jgi:hypothetical protein